jgi:hypothetical protein
VINEWDLDPGSFMACNELREKVGLPQDNLFKSEVMVWAEIPAKAIVCEWPWDYLSSCSFFALFPAFKSGHACTLKELKEAISEEAWQRLDKSLEIERLVEILIVRLKMPPSSAITQQISLTMLGWLNGSYYAEWHPTRQKNLGKLAPTGIQTLDKELYKRALILGLALKAELRETSYFRGMSRWLGTEKAEEWLDRYYSPTFERWWTSREEDDATDWEASIGVDHSDYGFLKYLNSF